MLWWTPRRRAVGPVVGPLAEEHLQRGEQAAALVVCDRQRAEVGSHEAPAGLDVAGAQRGELDGGVRVTLPRGRSVSSAMREASSASPWLARKPPRPRPGRPTPARTGPLTVRGISTSAPIATQTHAVRLSTSTASGRPPPHASASVAGRALEQRVGHLIAGRRLQDRGEMPAAEVVAEPPARAREVVRIGVQDAADERGLRDRGLLSEPPRLVEILDRGLVGEQVGPREQVPRTRRDDRRRLARARRAHRPARSRSPTSVRGRRDRRAAATAAGSDAARAPASSAGSRGSPRPPRAGRRAPGRRAPWRRWPRTSSRRARRPPARRARGPRPGSAPPHRPPAPAGRRASPPRRRARAR